MELKPFTAKTVTPGEPITAQAWNELIDGIKELNNYVIASQATSLNVRIANEEIFLDTVRVTAQREDGWLVEAVAPVNGDELFVFTSLPPGLFTVKAEAPGFKDASINVTVPTEDEINLTLEPDGAFMPNLIGVELTSALAALGDLDIVVGRLLDVMGHEIPPAKPEPEYASQPVLMQLPDPGVPVPPEGQVQLIVAASLQVEDSIEVPPLTGLTLTEARKALESIGLKLGKVETRTRGS